jgi:hypothetical protein
VVRVVEEKPSKARQILDHLGLYGIGDWVALGLMVFTAIVLVAIWVSWLGG